MKRAVWSVEAVDAFDDILRYIAADDPGAAEQAALSIEKTIEALQFMPTGRRGRVKDTYERVVTGLPFIIAYTLKVDAAGDETLCILRIIHGARNWPENAWPK